MSDATVATATQVFTAHPDLREFSVSDTGVYAIAQDKTEARRVVAAFTRTPSDRAEQQVMVWWPDGNGTRASGTVGSAVGRRVGWSCHAVPMTTTVIVSLAEAVASRVHAGQVDKVGLPYIEHPAAVAARLTTTDEKVVGWLHDVVEDTDMTLADLRTAGFTAEQVMAVDAMTKRRGEPLTDSMARVMADPIAPRVKRADVSHNADPARLALVEDEATRARLQVKYERTALLLGTTLDAVLAEFGVRR